jgi:hypothetical protein
MKYRNVSLSFLDGLIHYSVVLVVIIVIGACFAARLGMLGNEVAKESPIPVFFLGTFGAMAVILGTIQWRRLRYRYIPTATTIEESKQWIKQLVQTYQWEIHSSKGNTITIKTHPGFVNQH